MKALLASCVIVGAVLLSSHANADAAKALTARGCAESDILAAHEMTPCGVYIKGFLEGALLTDYAIIENIEQQQGFTSAFAQRALRTRVGSTSRNLPATFFAQFCLPQEGVTVTTVNKVKDSLIAHEGTNQSFDQQVYAAVKRTYPCQNNERQDR